MTNKNSRISFIFAGFTILFWSTVASAFKLALQQINFIHLLLIAVISSCISIFLIVLFTGKIKELKFLSAKEVFYSAVLGFLNPYLYYLILFKAYSILPAQIAQPLNFTWPVMLVLLSIPLLKQKPGWKGLLALLISFSGVLIISSQGNIRNFRIDQPFGVFLALISSLVWAAFWIFNMMQKTDDIIKLFLNFLFASVYIILTCAFTGNLYVPKNPGSIYAVYIGLFEMGITFVLWLKALQFSESTAKVSNLIYITPFLSLIIIRLVLKENIYTTSVIGLILIVTGILLQRLASVKMNFNKNRLK
ncbi:MAG: DMT family transporter [Bacteroidales bacterium]|nr:DMT family transporter [Bacteroidales bacterium]